MPKLVGVRERRHQPFYDTLIRTIGAPATSISSRTRMFAGGSSLGDLARTNMEAAGNLPSDQTLVVMSLQVFCHFRPAETSTGITDVTPFTARTPAGGCWGLYMLCQEQLYWTFQVGEKPQFQHPTFYTPAGGGIDGTIADTTLYVLNNGRPGKTEILKLAKPILIPPRQGFTVLADILTPSNQGGGALATGDDLRERLNSSTRFARDVKYVLDGVHTRDVL